METHASATVKINRRAKLAAWLRAHKLDLLVASGLVAVTGLVSGINMTHYPQRFEDEGTYVSQAWAVQEKGQLAHYTYWYDHPPMAWIQIAGYNIVTGANLRHSSSIAAGREFMLVLHLATIVLLYALARRMRLGMALSSVAVLLYGLSPLAVEFSRYVLLDNIALPWLLGAFLLALSPRRNLAAAVGSALCMAMAVLSKETFLVLLPALLYALYRTSDKRTRRFQLTAFLVIFSLASAFYVLYAALKNELFPGPGHVSLLGSALWQLSGRQGSGSIFDPHSDTRGLVDFWLGIDPWLIIAGTAAMPLAFIRRVMRPLALAMLISVGLLLRSGYLPYPYIVILLPFAALMIAEVLHLGLALPLRAAARLRGWLKPAVRAGVSTAALALAITAVVVLGGAWQPKLHTQLTQDPDAPSRAAIIWVEQHVPRDKRLVVESALWSDIERQGFDRPEPVWIYKTETDPEVVRELDGWQGIDYLVLNGPTLQPDSRGKFPTVFQAADHGTVIAQFGQDEHKVVIMKINK